MLLPKLHLLQVLLLLDMLYDIAEQKELSGIESMVQLEVAVSVMGLLLEAP